MAAQSKPKPTRCRVDGCNRATYRRGFCRPCWALVPLDLRVGIGIHAIHSARTLQAEHEAALDREAVRIAAL